jgi:hypothetical protein
MTIAVNKTAHWKNYSAIWFPPMGLIDASILSQLSCRNEGTNGRKFSFFKKKGGSLHCYYS